VEEKKKTLDLPNANVFNNTWYFFTLKYALFSGKNDFILFL